TATLDDRPRQQLRVRRSAVAVDVAAVGPVGDDELVEPQAREELGPNRGCGAVRAVDDELEAVERSRLRKHGAKMIQIGSDRLSVRDIDGLPVCRAPRLV